MDAQRYKSQYISLPIPFFAVCCYPLVVSLIQPVQETQIFLAVRGHGARRAFTLYPQSCDRFVVRRAHPAFVMVPAVFAHQAYRFSEFLVILLGSESHRIA
jgi:hypothetical protein